MATRRMFSKEVTNTSDFLMMSQSAQNLYFHFGMNADDDGFCEIFTVMRMTDSKPDDLKSLHDKGFVYVIDNKVCIVKDWHENNQLRSDRYKQSKYLSEQKYKEVYTTIMGEKIAEISLYTELLSSGKPMVAKLAPQSSIGKGREGKNRKEKTRQLGGSCEGSIIKENVEEFNMEEKLTMLYSSEKDHDCIIAAYWDAKKRVFENNKQYQAEYVRELRTAKRMVESVSGYSWEQVCATIEYLSKEYGKKGLEWRLETVEKNLSIVSLK